MQPQPQAPRPQPFSPAFAQQPQQPQQPFAPQQPQQPFAPQQQPQQPLGDAPTPIQAGGWNRRKLSTKTKKAAPKKVSTIKDRVKSGAKVHVGKRGGMYLKFDGKKHALRC